MMAHITCKNLTLGYNGCVVTENISFSVNKGDYLCVIGENGSGKSTLIKTILNLIKPINGSIEFSGSSTRGQIGYLPQQTDIQSDFPASVNEVILSGFTAAKKSHLSRKQIKENAMANMKKLGIEQLGKSSFRDLSGGQQQRVFLARALCAANGILLLDEPVSGLDPKITVEMYELVSALNKDENMTVIMVSHDISAALKYASHILHIGDTQLFFGTTDEYKKSKVGRLFTESGE